MHSYSTTTLNKINSSLPINLHYDLSIIAKMPESRDKAYNNDEITILLNAHT